VKQNQTMIVQGCLKNNLQKSDMFVETEKMSCRQPIGTVSTYIHLVQ